MPRDIENRDDVFLLVDNFYKKVREDDLLGPIFNNKIEDWTSHLQRLTDFWETNLLDVRSFKGNPLLKHQVVDAVNNFTINDLHFGRWLYYWVQTNNELFKGDNTEKAKRRARKMGTFLFIKMFENKPINK